MESALGNLWKGYIYQSADGKKIFPVRDTLEAMELIRWRKETVKRLQVYLVSQKPLASKTIPERNFLIRSWIPIFTGVGTNSGTIPWWMSGRLPMNVPGNTWFHMFRIIIMCWQLITIRNVFLERDLQSFCIVREVILIRAAVWQSVRAIWSELCRRWIKGLRSVFIRNKKNLWERDQILIIQKQNDFQPEV